MDRSSSSQEDATQKQTDSLTAEAWLSLHSSKLLYTVFTFNKLALAKKLRLSSHSCKAQGFFYFVYCYISGVQKSARK